MTSTPQQSPVNPGASNTASARAIADDATLSLAVDGKAAALALGVAHPRQPIHSRTAAARGYSDIVAHVARYHQHKLHRQLQPASALQTRLFNEFERARCEVLGGEKYSGSASNLAAFWNDHGTAELTSSRSDTERQVLQIIAIVREYFGLAFTAITSTGFAKVFRQKHRITLAKLQESIQTQDEFALLALQIIESTGLNSTDVNESSHDLKPADVDDETCTEDSSDRTAEHEQTDTDDVLSVTLREEDSGIGEANATKDSAIDTPDATANRDAPVTTESDGALTDAQHTHNDYQIFSLAEDEIVRAHDLCSQEQLVSLRELLDQHSRRHAQVIGKLSGKLQRVLMAEQSRHWEFNLAEGVLDTARLTRVVTQPMAPLSFKQETDSQFKDTAITLLVDNSRSMLGKPIAIAAACSDLLSQTLERCGVSVEILGFTTTELHRGPLHDRWTRSGASPNPGRLNGLRHIVYKPFDTPYRRSRMNFGVMLMKDLLKQNIDGESLLWAYQRLLRRPENRKVLIVISDGAPIDTSTMAANRTNFLVEHLNNVIKQIENGEQAELLAIGIGHDVTQYYQRAMKIMDVKDLSQSLLAHMSELFSRSARNVSSRTR